MDMCYKLSQYNTFLSVEQDRYLWNTFSGGLIKLDDSGIDFLKSFSGTDDDSAEFQALYKNGFIVPQQLDEYGRLIDDEKTAMYSQTSSNLSIVIALGMGCNYRCTYCFEGEARRQHTMTAETAHKIAQYICNLLKNNSGTIRKLNIKWFGGEPLLYVDKIELITNEILEHIATNQLDIHYSAGIITNGRLLTGDVLTRLLDLKVTSAQITVDGMCDTYCESKGASKTDFDAVIENIVNSAEHLQLSIRLNIPKNDADEAIRITDYLLVDRKLMGKIHPYMAQVVDYSASAESRTAAYKQFIVNYKKWLMHIIGLPGFSDRAYPAPMRHTTSCGLIRVSSRCIGPAGELFKCEHDFGNTDHIAGSIFDGETHNDRSRLYMRTSDERNPKCRECRFLPVCMGGCAYDHIENQNLIPCEEYTNLLALKKLISGVKSDTLNNYISSVSLADSVKISDFV